MDFIRVGLPQALAQVGPGQFQACLDSTCLLLGLWCLTSSAEWINQIRLFDDQGLLSWRLLSMRAPWIYRNRCLSFICRRRGVASILAVRLACAATVMTPTSLELRVGLLAVIALTGAFLKFRKWLSDDGSDQMGLFVAIGATAMAEGLRAEDMLLAFSGTLLIGGQLMIAYGSGGGSKLGSKEWRSGRALVGIMGTLSFGHDVAARIMSSMGRLALVCCWGVIVMETAFPIAAVGPKSVLMAFLSVFTMFHFATAIFMGLNTYTWCFLAAYPSVWAFNSVLTVALRRH